MKDATVSVCIEDVFVEEDTPHSNAMQLYRDTRSHVASLEIYRVQVSTFPLVTAHDLILRCFLLPDAVPYAARITAISMLNAHKW